MALGRGLSPPQAAEGMVKGRWIMETRELLEIECPKFSTVICGLVCVMQCCRLHIVVVCHS